MTPSMLDCALAYVAAGISVIPIDESTKRPAWRLLPKDDQDKPTWKPFQERLATEDEIRAWYRYSGIGIGGVTGTISGGLLVIDHDVPRFYEAWQERTGELIAGLVHQRTGDGFQVLLRCPSPGRNDKLAWIPDEAEDTGRTIAIETRGEGGYAVLAPSLHPSGRQYTVLAGDLTAIPRISQARADALLQAARALDEAPKTRQQLEAEAQHHHEHRAKLNGEASVIDAYNAKFTIEDVLESFNYVKQGSRYRRPDGEHASVTVNDGRSFHHNTNDPLCDGYWHTAFGVFCKLKHNDDPREAVKDAAKVLGIDLKPSHGTSGTVTPDGRRVFNIEAAKGPRVGAVEAPVTDDIATPLAPVGILLRDVEAEQVRWLWPGRIPFGKLTVLDGDPGLGKSAMTLDLAARLSAGQPLPDGTQTQRAGVVLLSVEDGLADTIRPRVEAAGGNLSRVLALTAIPDEDGDRLPAIPLDLPAIETAIQQVRAALVVIDPLMAFLGGNVHSFRDQDVRRALAPLGVMAERTGAAVVVVRHLNKAAGGSPLYRGGGSIGIIGAARSGLLVAADPEIPERRILASTKSNLGPPPAALAYRLEGTPNESVRVVWLGHSDYTAAKLLAAPADEDERTALDEACDVLRDLLLTGPVAFDDIRREARQANISDATLRRAKTRLGIGSEKQGYGKEGRWVWTLPVFTKGDHDPAKDAKDDHPKTMSTFGKYDHLRRPAESEPSTVRCRCGGLRTWIDGAWVCDTHPPSTRLANSPS